MVGKLIIRETVQEEKYFSNCTCINCVFNCTQKKRLPSLGKNTESLGELWLGLLRFYTEEFDFKEYVISIRQKKLLTTFEKQWTSKCIAIEGTYLLNFCSINEGLMNSVAWGSVPLVVQDLYVKKLPSMFKKSIVSKSYGLQNGIRLLTSSIYQ